MRRRLILFVPLALFALFLVVVAIGLTSPSERVIRSKMIGQPLPAFDLPPAFPARETASSRAFAKGEPRILNIFASWCVPCIAEAPQLMELKARGVPIDAVAIRDRPEDIARFLDRWGDPYRHIGLDNDSRVQLEMGSSGVPETFVIDGDGIIRHQHLGAINPGDVETILAAFEDSK